MMRKKIQFMIMALLASAGFLLFSGRQAAGCTTPVYQYAMERWVQDYYEGILIHSGQQNEEVGRIIDLFESSVTAKKGPLNLNLKLMDITSKKEEIKKLLKGTLPGKLPAMAIWFPYEFGESKPFWTGYADHQTIANIIHSEKRKAIGEQLLKMQVATWIFVPSGNRERDHEVMARFRQDIQNTREALKKDYLAYPGSTPFADSIDLFSIVSLPRDQKEESFLTTMLTAMAAGEYDNTEPVVFPVFGRGRVLTSLSGDDISAENIGDIIRFLINPCACQVKMANPGTDLLLQANWSRAIEGYQEATVLPVFAGVANDSSEYALNDDEIIDLTGGDGMFSNSRILVTGGIAVGTILASVVVISILYIRRKRRYYTA